jgi:hypothetical protein
MQAMIAGESFSNLRRKSTLLMTNLILMPWRDRRDSVKSILETAFAAVFFLSYLGKPGLILRQATVRQKELWTSRLPVQI